jgi:ligand-binding sensor domain-containing protein
MKEKYIVYTFDKTQTPLLRSIFIFVFAIFFTISAFAQQAREYSFKHFSVNGGLAANTVSAVAQDMDGYIWVATTNGLQRYDGNSFITFKAQENNASAIPTNHITGLYKDKKNNLWLIGDNNRIGIFNTRKFVFKEVNVPAGNKKMYIPQRIFELADGEILLHKDENIYQFNAAKNVFLPANDFFPLPAKWKSSRICWDAVYKKYWVSCDSGLVQYNPVNKHINYRGHNIDNDPVIKAFEKVKFIADAFTDPKGDVIFYSWEPHASHPDVYRYNRISDKTGIYNLGVEINLGYHEIQGFLVQKNGRVWVHGLSFFTEWTDNKKSFVPIPNEYRSEHSMQFDYAYQAFEDRENNIWIATDNGLFFFNPDAQIFNTYKLIRTDGKPATDAAVQAVAEVNEKIFVGCWEAGLYTFDRNFNPVPIPKGLMPRATQVSIWDMAVNGKTGHLWITLQGGGIIVYQPKEDRMTEIYPEIFGRSTIRQIDEDTSGNLWFGTQNGRVIKWDYKKAGNDPNKGYELICKTGQVHKVHYEYQGSVWVATLGYGLLKIDTKTNKIVKTFTSSGKPGEKIFMDSPGDMTYYDDTTLIVTAGCINVINTKTNKVSFITAEDGRLPSNTTESVERDDKGIVWIGMTNGICRLNLQKKLTTYYDRRDGIAYDKFNMAGVKELSDNRIIFYTDHNFLVFDPTKFVVQNLPPKPIITSFTLAGQSQTPDFLQSEKNITLKYNNTSIAIGFSALSFLQQRKLHYHYMLEGLDKEWIHTDQPIQAIFNYLPPGNYTFKVRSENADGVLSEEMASIPIVVRSPFWKTWWFYCLVILGGIMLLYLFDQERLKKRRSLEQVRTQIAGNLHDEINSALNNINVLSEIAKIKADRNIEQSKEFIDQISDRSRYMIESLDDMLWSIHPENDSMNDTIVRIREVTENMTATYNVNIDLIFDRQLQKLSLDMVMRHEVFFFYKETMLFLIQNNSCRQIFVNFKLTQSKLLLEILSECHKSHENFEKALENKVQKRVSSLKGDFEIESDDKSLSILLLVPIK